MILLVSEQSRAPREVIAVFGAGLIGSSVVDLLHAEGSWRRETWPLDWEDHALQIRQLDALGERIETLLDVQGARLRVIWSAGRAGFSASDEEVEGEWLSYSQVVDAVERICRRVPGVRGSFTLVSSAGGLFEGQLRVGPETPPSPKRPYGRLKLRQEERLLGGGLPLVRHIVRPTSVYGYIRPGQRRGLIPTLLYNGQMQHVSHFSGRMHTLRDFIWIEDVARYLVDQMWRENEVSGSRTVILASLKPSSILEIQRLVERILRRKLYVTYSHQADNGEDITFSPNVVAPLEQLSDLALTIRKIHAGAIGQGLLFASCLVTF